MTISKAAMVLSALASIERMPPMPVVAITDFKAPKRRRTGKAYPFASKRQNDRYARQIAAGQIRNAACVEA